MLIRIDFKQAVQLGHYDRECGGDGFFNVKPATVLGFLVYHNTENKAGSGVHHVACISDVLDHTARVAGVLTRKVAEHCGLLGKSARDRPRGLRALHIWADRGPQFVAKEYCTPAPPTFTQLRMHWRQERYAVSLNFVRVRDMRLVLHFSIHVHVYFLAVL